MHSELSVKMSCSLKVQRKYDKCHKNQNQSFQGQLIGDKITYQINIYRSSIVSIPMGGNTFDSCAKEYYKNKNGFLLFLAGFFPWTLPF